MRHPNFLFIEDRGVSPDCIIFLQVLYCFSDFLAGELTAFRDGIDVFFRVFISSESTFLSSLLICSLLTFGMTVLSIVFFKTDLCVC